MSGGVTVRCLVTVVSVVTVLEALIVEGDEDGVKCGQTSVRIK